ncbi:MAG: ABC transporter substrate-binding protein [Gammaproteobacteria bacterium]|nr:MAG: ABC transporter substrate-binding protein [Gammaproteobacteria bacterium]
MSLVRTAGADESDRLAQVVAESMDRLVATFEARKNVYYEDPEEFYRLMEEALASFVDFERIALRVMGRYRRQASEAQIRAFTEVFKRSLFDAYGKALVESGKFTVNVRRAVIDARRSTRASVMVDIRSASGNVYPVVYSMHQGKDAVWRMENVIVNGVNIGLAFKERFEQAYLQSQGDIDKVIREWKSDVKIETEKPAA